MSWVDMEIHLLDYHGVREELVDQMDSDMARTVHLELHMDKIYGIRRHGHENGPHGRVMG